MAASGYRQSRGAFGDVDVDVFAHESAVVRYEAGACLWGHCRRSGFEDWPREVTGRINLGFPVAWRQVRLLE